MDKKTIIEPDISVICDKNKLTDKGCTGVREYWIVNPMKQTIFVYHLEETKFEAAAYTFLDQVKVNIYDDLWIDFQEISL